MRTNGRGPNDNFYFGVHSRGFGTRSLRSVPNTRRLIPGVAGFDPDLAYILVVESRPTLDQINHPKIQVM